jgi:hypothetical protein
MNLESFEFLLSSLQTIEESELPTLQPPENQINLLSLIDNYPQYKDVIHKAIQYADEALITDQGRCDWDAIQMLKDEGYEVFAGEQDRWGWLSGCIQTKKGRLVYG